MKLKAWIRERERERDRQTDRQTEQWIKKKINFLFNLTLEFSLGAQNLHPPKHKTFAALRSNFAYCKFSKQLIIDEIFDCCFGNVKINSFI